MDNINGTVELFYVGGVKIDCQTDFSDDYTREEIEVTCKDSLGDYEFLPGKGSRTMGVTFIFDNAATEGWSEMFSDWKSRTKVELRSSETEGTGTKRYKSQNGYLTGMSMSAPFEGVVTCTGTFKATGPTVEQSIT